MDIINNEYNLQFEFHQDGEIARLEYRFYKKDIAMMHTVVPESMQGQGVASALAEEAFAFAKAKNKRVMVYCPFVAKYVKKHPELSDQIDRDYHPNL